MEFKKERLICNTLHRSNGTLIFKQVARDLSVVDVSMMIEFHVLLLEAIKKFKYYQNELKGYSIQLYRVNHMSWRIDILKDDVLYESIEYHTTKNKPGLPKASILRFNEVLEGL